MISLNPVSDQRQNEFVLSNADLIEFRQSSDKIEIPELTILLKEKRRFP